MVDWFVRWHEEKDYSTYPKTKWCDMKVSEKKKERNFMLMILLVL